jgi:DegV family protein with EDD domain
MEKIRFITDSASDMNHSREDVTILPLHIRFGDDEYADGVTISHREFYEKLIECDTLPTTSLVSPAVFEDAYEQAVSAGETVIVITISGKLSGTCQSARIAAEDYEGKVFVVDSMNATIGERILVEYGLQLKDQGKSAEEIVSILEKEKSKIHTMGLLDTLEYLKKGGRISSTVAFIGGALAIKPVVAVSDGEIIMLGKARGSKNGSNFLIREIEKADGVDFSRPFCLGYTGLSDELLQKYIHDSEHLWKDYAKELPISTLGARIAAEDYEGKVFVVDSMNATIGERILVEYGLQLKDQGKSAEEIVSILEKEKSKIHTMGLLDTLEYLKKGGRISSTVAFIGGALAIKPVVAVSDGEIIMLGKARGSKNGSNFLIREIEKADGVDFSRPFCLGYTGLSDELLQKYIHDSEHLWKDYAKELPISTLGATIGTHVGPGAVAVAFFEH